MQNTFCPYNRGRGDGMGAGRGMGGGAGYARWPMLVLHPIGIHT